MADAAVGPMFISFAQNFEDVMLARCFPGASGFYVDVGAHDPDIDSVTRAFYDRGWSGLNIEPLPGPAARLRARRPRDVNLEIAVGDRDGTITLHDIDGASGVSTTDPTLAEAHAALGYARTTREVRLRRLADVINEHAPGRAIDFLKVDVEGAELAVLRGAALDRIRPAVLVVETRLPVTFEMVDRVDDVPDRWEDVAAFLEPLRYRLVWRDGTNAFFVADERADLARHFTRPPGVFDRFVHAASVRAADTDAEIRRRLDDGA